VKTLEQPRPPRQLVPLGPPGPPGPPKAQAPGLLPQAAKPPPQALGPPPQLPGLPPQRLEPPPQVPEQPMPGAAMKTLDRHGQDAGSTRFSSEMTSPHAS